MVLEHLPKIGEVLIVNNESLAYVVNIVENIYYLYMDNKLVGWVIQHTIGHDPETGEPYEEYNVVNSYEIVDYCILPEVEYILKRD